MAWLVRHFLFVLLTLPALSCLGAQIARGEDAKQPALSPATSRILAWLPEDTETVVAASAFRMPAAKPVELGMIDMMSLAQILACGELAALDKGSYVKTLAERKVAIALRGGRHFETVSAFGAHRSEGCAVIVFEEELGEAGREWTNLARRSAKEVRTVRGRDVFVFPSTVTMEGTFKLKPWQGTYLVLLSPDTVLCATSDRYLDEVLKRFDTKTAGAKPTGRALPDSLAEWKHVDLSAAAWMIRHLPEEQQQPLIDGVTWSMTRDRCDIEYLPVANAADKVEKQARSKWQPPGMELSSEIKRSNSGSVVVTLNASINAGPDSFLTTLFLYALQNESGAVGAQ